MLDETQEICDVGIAATMSRARPVTSAHTRAPWPMALGVTPPFVTVWIDKRIVDITLSSCWISIDDAEGKVPVAIGVVLEVIE